MHEATYVISDRELPPDKRFEAITQAAAALVPPGTDRIAAMATIASLLYYSLPDVNWCGFYRTVGNRLIIGPFQGKPACLEISFGRGVCGRAAAEQRTIVVSDVNAFPDHIACDPASRSEIVVPLIEQGTVVGVLDLDSPLPGRFTQHDAPFLGTIAAMLLERTAS